MLSKVASNIWPGPCTSVQRVPHETASRARERTASIMSPGSRRFQRETRHPTHARLRHERPEPGQ
eukprot:6070613-Pyramimonas_sp.AAC.1